MIVFGWRRWSNILGTKVDEWLRCGTVGQHLLVRKTFWFSLFFFPVLLLRVSHGMICSNCGEWTGIPLLTMLGGNRSGRLPLQRPRPNFGQLEPDAWGRRPQAAHVLDSIVRNDKPGLMAL